MFLVMRLTIENSEDTTRIGLALGRSLQGGDIVGLAGDLGAGKTYFVQQVMKGLELPDDVPVTSPTFTLINEYVGGRLTISHGDLYRLERAIEVDELGLDEMCRMDDRAVLVEWCDRFPVLPVDYLHIHILITGEFSREMEFSAGGERSLRLMKVFKENLVS